MKHFVTIFYDNLPDKSLSYMNDIEHLLLKWRSSISDLSINGSKYEKTEVGVESDSAFLSGGLSEIFPASATEFVTLGKYVAPQVSKAGSTSVDATLVALALDGHDADHIARIVCDRAAELTVRLVELRTGPLGYIRPAASEPLLHLFADVKLCRSRLHVPEKNCRFCPLSPRRSAIDCNVLAIGFISPDRRQRSPVWCARHVKKG